MTFAAVAFETRQLVRAALSALGQEIAELDRPGPRARLCVMTALSVALAATAALALHLDNPWWAAISGYVSVQANRPASIRRGALRIAGTVAGATIGFITAPWLAYDHAACALFVLVFTAMGVLGMMLSTYGYAWLFAGITSVMVVFMSLDAPSDALPVAFYRTVEVALGTIAALVIASLLAREEPAPLQASQPGWSDLLGVNWPALMHALRTGVAVALLPFLWNWLALPSLSQVAITVAAVMAVPSLSDDLLEDGRKIATRGLQRMLGCLFGGFAGLGALALSITQFAPWLAILMAGVWIGAHVQASERGVGYAGTQGAVVFIMTLVQGSGPPESILPGIDRFAGVLCGLAILLIVSLISWPSRRRDDVLIQG